MGETTTLRIALQSARELELEVEDAEEARSTIETAFEEGRKVLWVVDTRGHRFGLVVEKLAFIEIEGGGGRGNIGFGLGD